MYTLSTAQQTLISSTIMMGPNLPHLLFSIISSICSGSEVCSEAQHGEAIVDVSRRFLPMILMDEFIETT
jgi:hypothetical protein